MKHATRRISPSVATADPCEVIALFALDGTLVQGSETYRRAIRDQWIAHDLLALPRALALRSACGSAPLAPTDFTGRLVSLEGVERVVQPRWIDAGGSGDSPLIALTLTPGASARESADRAGSGTPGRRRRRCGLRRPVAMPGTRGRRPGSAMQLSAASGAWPSGRARAKLPHR